MRQGPKGDVSDDERRAQVRGRYASIATTGQLSVLPRASSCCAEGAGSSCCGDSTASLELGYSAEQLAGLPDGANLGLGCGNPTAIAALTPVRRCSTSGAEVASTASSPPRRWAPAGRWWAWT